MQTILTSFASDAAHSARRAIWVALGAMALTSCATVKVSGLDLDEDQWVRDNAEVRQRAAFDLGCASDKLELAVLASTEGVPKLAQTMGVTGCEKKSVYKKADGAGWVLNSPTQKTEN